MLVLLLMIWATAQAQFAPPAGTPGSTALHRDSAVWVGWASQCQVERGPLDIRQPSQGLATVGTPTMGTGPSDGAVVSLGDGGTATLTFAYPIRNGSGPDFAIFENAFSNTFLELALVEVSSDGQRFVRFPAISNTDTAVQVGGFGHIDATRIYNLAGKYRAAYGTPFDLDELQDSAGIDLNAVTHVRLIDAVGSVDPAYGKRDSRGWLINDPWTTPFPSGGFDLDAVGVLHENRGINVQRVANVQGRLYPNPVSELLFCDPALSLDAVTIYNALGHTVAHFERPIFPLSMGHLPPGVYVVAYANNQTLHTQRLIKN